MGGMKRGVLYPCLSEMRVIYGKISTSFMSKQHFASYYTAEAFSIGAVRINVAALYTSQKAAFVAVMAKLHYKKWHEISGDGVMKSCEMI